jgi:hypothetical protein
MDAKKYFSELNTASQFVFERTTQDTVFLGNIHDCSLSLQEWVNILEKDFSINLIKHSIEQIEISGFSISLGLYRQGFASLRLALEMLFGGIYFSSNKIEFIEWSKNSRDLQWAVISGVRPDDEDDDPQRGVLSHRFVSAFGKNLLPHMKEYQQKASRLYRTLSEFVHGNNATWNVEAPSLGFDEEVLTKFKSCVIDFKNISEFILCVRYLNELDAHQINQLEVQINDELRHIQEIRVVLGGPVSS